MAGRVPILLVALTLVTHTGAAADEADDCDVDELGACKRRAKPASDELGDVSSLKVPTAPALSLLGGARVAAERPAIPAPFTTSVTASGGISAESAPYWGLRGDTTTVQMVLDRSPLEAVAQDLTLSLATGDRDVARADGAIRSVAAGIRTTLLPGRPSDTARRCYDYMLATFRDRANRRAAEIQARMHAWRDNHPAPTFASDGEPLHEEILFEELAGGFPDRPRNTLAGWRDALLEDAENFSAAGSPEENERARRAYARSEERYLAAFAAWSQQDKVDDLLAEWDEAHDAYLAEVRATIEPLPLPARFERCRLELFTREGWTAAIAAGVVGGYDGELDEPADGVALLGASWATAGYSWVSSEGLGRSVLAVGRWQKERGFDHEWIAGGRVVWQGARWGIAPEYTQHLTADIRRIGLGVEYQLRTGVWLNVDAGYAWGDDAAESTWSALRSVVASLQWALDLDRGLELDHEAYR